jgi:hypothetical protein
MMLALVHMENSESLLVSYWLVLAHLSRKNVFMNCTSVDLALFGKAFWGIDKNDYKLKMLPTLVGQLSARSAKKIVAA